MMGLYKNRRRGRSLSAVEDAECAAVCRPGRELSLETECAGWCLDLALSSLKTVESKRVLFKPLSLLHSVKAAKAVCPEKDKKEAKEELGVGILMWEL